MLNIEYAPKFADILAHSEVVEGRGFVINYEHVAIIDNWLTDLVDQLRTGDVEVSHLVVTNEAMINNFIAGNVGSWYVTEKVVHIANIILDGAQGRITSGTCVIDGAQNEIRIGGTNVVLDGDAESIYINSETWESQGIQLEYNLGTPRAYIGDGADQYFEFDGTNVSWKGTNTSLTAAGLFTAANAVITGTITATVGAIGGWTIAATTISSANITLDSANDKIQTGQIYLDGANQRLVSTNYVSGAQGAGFMLNENYLEVGNILARGLFRTATFQHDVIHVIAGNLFLAPNADVLATDMTAADNSTLTIEGNVNFSVGDLLRIKDGVDDEWLEVTNIGYAPTYTVTRDKNGDYAADTNPTWKKGVGVANYGGSGSGGVFMTASEANAPYLAILTHAGAPWTTLNTYGRIGNMNGVYGVATESYGVGVGLSDLSGHYLKYDSASGTLLIKGDIVITGGGGTAALSDIGDSVVLGLDANGVLITKVNPASAVSPAGAGLFLGSDYLGYYAGAAWTTYMDNSGNFFLGGVGGKLTWNAGTSTLNISGVLTVESGSSGIANYSDYDPGANCSYSAAASPPADPSEGDVWFQTDTLKLMRYNGSTWDVISTEDTSWRHASDSTKIDGGDIYTGTVTATQINVATLSAITADVGTLTAGILQSSDGKIKMDLDNKWLKVWDAQGTPQLRVHIGYIA